MPAKKRTSRKKAELTLLVPSKLGLSKEEVRALKMALEPVAKATISRTAGTVSVVTGVTNGNGENH